MSLRPVIQLDSVTKRYGQETALDNVSIEVPPGVVYALLGENGAGKTTSIRAMLGLIDVDQGHVRVLERDSQQEGVAIRRQIGYVSERPSMDDWMTVDQIGWFTAGFYGPGFEQRFQHHADRFRIPRSRKIKQLSKGMRSKVALSLALAVEPRLLILDEPTSGLDTLVRREFLESMVEFTDDGKTVFLSSHQIHEVERVADIVTIVRDGRILVSQSLDELKDSTTEATIILPEEGTLLEVPQGCLTEHRRGRQSQIMIRADEETTGRMLHSLPQVESFSLRRPSLEEIFVSFMKSSPDKTISPSSVPASEVNA